MKQTPPGQGPSFFSTVGGGSALQAVFLRWQRISQSLILGRYFILVRFVSGYRKYALCKRCGTVVNVCYLMWRQCLRTLRYRTVLSAQPENSFRRPG